MCLSAQDNLSVEAIRSVCLVVCVPAVVLGAEIFYRLVDYPSRLLARNFYDWIQE